MNIPPPFRCEPRWYDGAMRRHQLPPLLRSWLLDDSSLTRRLQQACTGRFSVELVSQGWARPMHNEAAALGVSHQQRALIRQVRLCCEGTPWVYARTVIPLRTMRGAQRRLAHLGNRPLGAFLFADPSLRRSPLQVARLCGSDALLRGEVAETAAVWGRRSLFRLRSGALLVSEFFLPTLPLLSQEADHA